VLEVGSVRVGFVGLTSDIVPRMAKPFSWGFAFTQGEDAYRELIDRSVAALRADGAEIVVVMSELGLHRDRRLADVVQPGVDVFFSGHTHEATFAPLESASGAVVVESGNDSPWMHRSRRIPPFARSWHERALPSSRPMSTWSSRHPGSS
jgi:2',3'-cyclic-nucleotide 2'-phosphodiesterase (5'-nucleotidase family)